MEPTSLFQPETASERDEELLIQAWRTEQLRRLGLPRVLAEAFAGHVDWHDLAALLDRGCPPDLALEIVR